MKKEDIKLLMKKNIIDFNELVLNNYYKMDLDEIDAVIIIKLHSLLKRGITFINPEKLSKILSLTKTKTANKLDNLTAKGYVKFELIKLKNGKESESFNLDFFIEKILMIEFELKQKEQSSTKKVMESDLVDMLETELKKPLSVLDIQIITKWLSEDNYTKEQIEEALLVAMKNNKVSMKYIDNLLLNKSYKDDFKRQKNSVLKDFNKIWKE
ncbi:hypothetical protein CI105_07875 [Candidatus Izimaplasma bacterium ZiA1]|uniref:DnaD domain protein n=1 Tax=Candidatus Izimoplasma sp. ZiA1 TaxID=2024899 RepID=UPI000BAA46B5|nr:hypothetical protein CI105_07875 [Candidatus Izimaplasma bacterium ZiA1]